MFIEEFLLTHKPVTKYIETIETQPLETEPMETQPMETQYEDDYAQIIDTVATADQEDEGEEVDDQLPCFDYLTPNNQESMIYSWINRK